MAAYYFFTLFFLGAVAGISGGKITEKGEGWPTSVVALLTGCLSWLKIG